MKPGADFQQASYPALNPDPANGWFSDPAENFQERGFPGPVPTDNANDVSLVNLKRNVFHGPKILVGGSGIRGGTSFGRRIRLATLCYLGRNGAKFGDHPSS